MTDSLAENIPTNPNESPHKKPLTQQAELKKGSKIKNLLATLLLNSSLLTSCTLKKDIQPTYHFEPVAPIAQIQPTQIPTTEAPTERIVLAHYGDTLIYDLPFYPPMDEMIINPPPLEEVSAEQIQEVMDATCMIIVVPDFNGTDFNLGDTYTATGVHVGDGVVLGVRHVLQKDDGSSELDENSAIFIVRKDKSLAQATGEPIFDPAGGDIMALRVPELATDPHVPIDLTMPQAGETVVQSGWHTEKNVEGFNKPNAYRVIYLGESATEGKSLFRDALDSTPNNMMIPGFSGAPLYNTDTRGIFAIGSGQAAHKDTDGAIRQGHEAIKIDRNADGIPEMQRIGLFNVSTATTITPAFVELIK